MIAPGSYPYATIVMSVILLLGITLFGYLIYRRFLLLRFGSPDPRIDKIKERAKKTLHFALFQKRLPRYPLAGFIHIVIFSGFLILAIRSLTLIGQGFFPKFSLLPLSINFAYSVVTDYTELLVMAICLFAMIRRAIMQPARYMHEEDKVNKKHKAEAYIVLALIVALMGTDISFEGSMIADNGQPSLLYPASSVASFFYAGFSEAMRQTIYLFSYWSHIVILLVFLCYLPLSKHFHVITAIPNVFFSKLNKGSIKPVFWERGDWKKSDNIGASKITDFTWKHIFDFYTCTDCGRCTDNCPASAVGRLLSPRMISIKLRDHAYASFPLSNPFRKVPVKRFLGDIIEEETVWACTTCGACEEECPVFIEYIDKIVDMRRYLVEAAKVPESLHKPLLELQRKGNPYGEMPQKRTDWATSSNSTAVNILNESDQCDLLFFVDSCASFDPRAQDVARSIVTLFQKADLDFGILGKDEVDSGHEVRRMGEEGLFEQLSERNTNAINKRKYRRIVTTDPHAMNCLKNDYHLSHPVVHYSEVLLETLNSGKLKWKGSINGNETYTFHDPCYLGRHNGIYDTPRKIMRAIPGMRMVEMDRSKARSFCCGGGGLYFWHEVATEKERMAVKRVNMAHEAGANVIVTACPFCLINLEEAIKANRNTDQMKVIDLIELVNNLV